MQWKERLSLTAFGKQLEMIVGEEEGDSIEEKNALGSNNEVSHQQEYSAKCHQNQVGI